MPSEMIEHGHGVSAPADLLLSREASPIVRTGPGEGKKQPSGRAKCRPTLYGWILIFLLGWLPMTAVGSANNFLFIVFVLLLGLALVSHWLGKRNVRLVSLSRRFPDEVFAGTPFPVLYVMQTDVRPWGAVTLKVTESEPLGFTEPAGFPVVRPGEAQVFSHLFTIPSRGEHRVGLGLLESTFPFGLARYVRACGTPETLLVFPRIDAVKETIPLHAGGIARGRERSDLFGTIPFHFREYTAGDPYKRIDWKKTARTGELTTRVFSEEGSGIVIVALPRDASEEAISKAASLAVHCGDLGIPVSLKGPGFMIEAGVGKRHVRKLLTVLARWDRRADEVPRSREAAALVAEIDTTGGLTWKTSGGAGVASS